MRARLDLTAGQVWTLSLGLLLGVLLLATSVPPVWERRGLVVPAAAQLPPSVAVPPPAGGLVSGLLPAPAPAPAPALPPAPEPLLFEPPAPLAPPAPLPATEQEQEPVAQPAPSPVAPRTEVGPATPLRVLEAGYTSSGPEPGLPEGGLPVSARLGERLSTVHVRLTGQAGFLILPLSAESGANVRPEDARVRACRITTTEWTPERPGPGVPFDPDDCADGVLSATELRFDLSAFPDRAARNGFALVADLRGSSMTSPRTFRLTLDPEDTP